MRIYNSMTKKKEEFTPVEPGKIKMYACGPTVYNYFHIGNARPFLFFDVVKRYFEYLAYEVNYVQNITDIDDKIIAKANEENVDSKIIAEKFSKAFLEDLSKLGINEATHNPKATKYIGKMIALIRKLEKSGYAYESNGDVYFRVNKSDSYGKLSKKKLEDLQVGARIQANNQKENPFDFTLWKKAKEGEPSWNSPWGEGRPGWHTECVVMSQDLLGDTFDIHGGGSDLIFPHHENEIAQGEALTGKDMANFWMHVGFLNIEGEKMSKSLNNFFTARDILEKYDEEAIRFFFLSKHYRSPIDFNEDIIKESEKAVGNFYKLFSEFEDRSFLEMDLGNSLNEYDLKFQECMNDDFNSAKALAVLFELQKEVKSSKNDIEKRKLLVKKIYDIGQVLGFFQDIESKIEVNLDGLSEDLIELLIRYRKDAKKNRNYELSDNIRNDLGELGIELQDTVSGTVWKYGKKS